MVSGPPVLELLFGLVPHRQTPRQSVRNGFGLQACMKMDETLYHVADKIKNFAVMFVAFSPLKSRMLLLLLHAYVCSPSLHATTLVIHLAFPSHGFACTRFRPCSYLVDISEVPDFNTMYELYDPVTVMFFFRSPQPSNAPASRFECKFARTPTP